MTRLLEYATAQGIEGTEEGIVRGVKVLGFVSQNGRTYKHEAVKSAVTMYDGVRVNIDHPAKGSESRSYADRFGRLANSRLKEDGLYADLIFNPQHRLAEQFRWDVEHSPQSVGLSHAIEARTAKSKGGGVSIESIEKVISVDVVADPASVRGLFESATKHEAGDDTVSEKITIEALKRDGIYETIREDIAKELHESGELDKLKQLNVALTSELDALKTAAKASQKLAKVKAAIGEAKLPEAAVTDLFVEQCVAADENKLTALIEDRLLATSSGIQVSGSKPLSKEQTTIGTTTAWEGMDAKQFAAAITE